MRNMLMGVCLAGREGQDTGKCLWVSATYIKVGEAAKHQNTPEWMCILC